MNAKLFLAFVLMENVLTLRGTIIVRVTPVLFPLKTENSALVSTANRHHTKLMNYFLIPDIPEGMLFIEVFFYRC